VPKDQQLYHQRAIWALFGTKHNQPQEKKHGFTRLYGLILQFANDFWLLRQSLFGGGENFPLSKTDPPKSGHESPPSAPALLPETPVLCQKHRGLLPNGRRIPEPGISRLHGKISKEICDSIGRILSS